MKHILSFLEELGEDLDDLFAAIRLLFFSRLT